ncbi:superoxide dismutase family protein [Cyclobacterium sp. 1_MG-2023]|uniref:superoxide dismutase family protein n=1 Tax=Cyclobacterium sp. 1_MG-2023 TaxID=3062681 RepID=UPI0026E20916|nr:superoxide dismutase family protein [Cyclobacterium sp. 1_MG-2023]MDO6438865.1 superoxide dismutase family protein [Cyclobacterium sp. 1_MG-2023]
MKTFNYFLFIGAVSLAVACGPGANNSEESATDRPEITENQMDNMESETDTAEQTAMAVLSGASGSEVSGTATFTQTAEGKVKLVLSVNNLSTGKHAVHLHENGDCSAADATSAGGHWNPEGEEHGKRGEGEFHAGDINNLTVGEDGLGSLVMVVDGWSIGDGEDSDILNKAVIIHAEADDFTSQPSGAAGSRVACGVIQENG